jgi:cysteine desulfurase family protein (TIGR01976 family)
MVRTLDIEASRALFPALSLSVAGRPAVFLDGPAGSQVPRPVIDAVGGYLAGSNANCGGPFATSQATDAMLDAAHRGVADFLGADDADLTVFGPNMTTLTLGLARSLGRMWGSGDEILVSQLDHDANFTPWVQAARDAGATVREIGIRRDDCTLDLDDLRAKLGDATRFVAVGAASNAVGSVTDVRAVADAAHAVGAPVFVDAVHLAPHRAIDIQAWDCDFVACSAYKFFGPHVGMLWGRRRWLEELDAYKLRPAPDSLHGRWMTGTQNHEGIAGTLAAIDYLAGMGRDTEGHPASRRDALLAAFERIERHERDLAEHMLDGLESLDDVRVWGITDRARMDERVATFSFTHRRHKPREIAQRLGAQGIFVWYGNYYALPLTQALGLEPDGMVRVGLLHYNRRDEIDRLIEALGELG